MINLRLFRRLLFVLSLVFPLAGFSQDFPIKPIRIVVPVPPGGAADTLARIVGDKLTAKWGQPVLVENRSGAGGNIGAELVYNAPPDGYTLLMSTPGPLAINKNLYKKLRYDSDEFVPVSVIAANPNVLLVHPKLPVKTVQELIAYAKAHPNKLNYASSGPGSTTHLAGELFKQLTGAEITHIPYKGGPPAYADLMGGQVEMMFQGLATALPQINAGELRVLAVGSEKRHAALPDVPTMNETLPGFLSVSWTGLVAPPKTPVALVNQIFAVISEALKHQDPSKMTKGFDARDLIVSSPVEATKFIKEEKERWGAVIKSTNTRVD